MRNLNEIKKDILKEYVKEISKELTPDVLKTIAVGDEIRSMKNLSKEERISAYMSWATAEHNIDWSIEEA